MIQAKDIRKNYGNLEVLKDINLVFEEGKQNLIIGQSGSGKTVLLKCLVGLYEPDNGSILYSGRDFVSMNKNAKIEIRKEIGMLFQGSALFDSMTVMDNVMFPLLMFSNLSNKEKTDRANFCIDRVGLTDAHDKLPSEISGGMQKRAAIARAIALNPKYLFCDEPNSGLDPKTGVKIDNLIEEITQEYKITTVINTHDMNSVIQHGDNINYIYEGNVWWKGNKDTFLGNDNPELQDFIYSTEILKRIKPK